MSDDSLFSSRLWIDALLRTFPRWRDASLTLALPDSRTVRLPMLQTDRVGVWRWLDAMPYSFFGAPLVSSGTLTRDDLALVLHAASRGAGWLSLNLDPCDPLARAENIARGAVPLTTHILRLPHDFDAYLNGLPKTMRYDIRAAERKGVTARRGAGIPDFEAYFRLTEAAARRWQLSEPPYPLALYHALAALPAESVSLWLADYEGKTIAGVITMHYMPGRVLYWGSAFDPAFAHLMPSKLLQREAIGEAIARGAEIYHMGPSVGFDGKPLDGVRAFKEGFGAHPHDYAIPILMNPWAMRARAVRDRLHLPR